MPDVKDELDTRQRSLAAIKAPSFAGKLLENKVGPLKRWSPKCLQLNVGLYCNQACTHCHVESSPLKTLEQMSAATAQRCLDLLERTPSIHTLDLTGGAPEMNQCFKDLVLRARAIRPDLRIIDRCNLTVLLEPGQEQLGEFLRDNRVDVIASLPCYSERNVDAQRGRKVFERSMQGLQILNQHGYGDTDSGLKLDLVYNPAGAFLPPSQSKLEVKYKQELSAQDIFFNNLITITNMPIKRFFDFLRKQGTLDSYMDLLVRNFNAETVRKGLMCHDTVSVNWQGKIFDCDFNQQLDLRLKDALRGKGDDQLLDIWRINSFDELVEVPIVTRAHCFGCTAGQGSS
eukprot:gnl/MRDRNA2_/MRDRNA2_229382_c0_seq1.p1 gnl/MRDRNA2_/MRDRNA2_229382_c0~~gnl/MRDRNA2_/MRDRNA2_229382_c0_seq1.p1  ORF type:complete len:368 (+),score=56.92 gnl/MRDRNA2_/MRDRNA2_229382_c0_seq1:75-1106(+)